MSDIDLLSHTYRIPDICKSCEAPVPQNLDFSLSPRTEVDFEHFAKLAWTGWLATRKTLESCGREIWPRKGHWRALMPGVQDCKSWSWKVTKGHFEPAGGQVERRKLGFGLWNQRLPISALTLLGKLHLKRLSDYRGLHQGVYHLDIRWSS